MSDFDPYLKWLGIRDSQRPPNHYRLLGLDSFESDPEVISIAADRQMAHIRTFQIGKHGEISQKILNELAEARRCLLNDAKRSAYDQSIRSAPPSAQIIEGVSQPSPTDDPTGQRPIKPSVAGPLGDAEFPVFNSSDLDASSHETTIRSRKKSKPSNRVLVQLFAIAGGGLAAVVVGGWLIQSGWLQQFVSNNEGQVIEPRSKLEPNNQPARLSATSKPRKNNSSEPVERPAANAKRNKNSRSIADNPANRKLVGKTASKKDPRNDKAIPEHPIGPLAAGELMPWDQPRWPPLPEELSSPSTELDRLLQRTRIAIALREFDEALKQWQLVKLQVRALDPRIDMARQVEELNRFWKFVNTAASNLRLGDEFVFRDTPVKVQNLVENGVFVKLADGRGQSKFFATNFKDLDRDLVVALARKQGSYDRATVDRLLAMDFAHEQNQLANRSVNVGFAGIDPNAFVPKTNPPRNSEIVIRPRVRKPIPDSDKIAESRRWVRQQYEKGFERSSSPKLRRLTIQQMTTKSAKVDVNEPAKKYALLDEAASLAESCGETKTGVEALDLLNDEFDINFWELAKSFMINATKKVSTQKQLEDTASTYRQLAVRALRESRYEDAFFLANKATPVAEKVGDITIINNSVFLKNETKEIVRMESRSKRALAVIKSNPDDGKANEELGNFLCLVENNFEQGLNHWAKSKKIPLVTVATLERRFAAGDNDEELPIAEAWFQVGEKRKTYRDARCLARARHWYDLARHKRSGLYLKKIEARIDDIDSLLERIPSVLDLQLVPDKLLPFWGTEWVFDQRFAARFSRTGFVRVSSPQDGTRSLPWRQSGNEYRVANPRDNTTIVFRPRPSGQTVAFEKIDDRTGRVILNGIGYPRDKD